jgi:site-specific DNA-methyltransferase (adenine-specific)
MDIFYKDDIATIYNYKFEDIINKLDFNLIITDPPYNINYKYVDYKDNMSDEAYINMLSILNNYSVVMIHYLEEFCGVVGEALGKPMKIVPWCYNSNLQRQCRGIAWYGCKPDFNKVKQPYKNLNDKRIQKLIENGSDGSRLYDYWNDIQLVKNVSKEKNLKFTNQIPIKLLERIILLTTNEGDIILDPFFGSGSLYFACKNTNRKCIGIEQSKEHLNIFKERLNSLN